MWKLGVVQEEDRGYFFLWGGVPFLERNVLERQEILKYLRRNGLEPSHDALRKRLLRGLRNGSVTKESVTEYARDAEPIPTPKPILRVGPRTKPIPPPRVRFEIPVSTTKPIPAPRTKPIPAQGTRPVPIPRKIMSKLRPIPPPRKRKEKPAPPPRKRKEKPVPPPRLQKPEWLTCDHGTTEEIDGIIFCIRCGLEIDHDPLREGLLRERECQAFDIPGKKEHPVFKRRPGPRKSKKEYIPVSPSEVPLLVRKEKDKEVKDQILGYLGLLDEN